MIYRLTTDRAVSLPGIAVLHKSTQIQSFLPQKWTRFPADVPATRAFLNLFCETHGNSRQRAALLFIPLLNNSGNARMHLPV